MSRVFVASELRLGRLVVVKVLSPELAAGISAERFEREIQLAASLQQANIVPIFSAGDTNGLPFYTMPFVEGQSLRTRLVSGVPLSTPEVLRILGDVARALQYAHERGIVHRDIKPDNVLLSGGTAVVTDFGIAKALSASRTTGSGATITQLGTSIGTPAYMAPEQAAGDPHVDSRADIYAFGCMAFELLAGHPPFAGRTPQRVLAAHMGEAPPSIAELRPGVSPSLADLVMRCLAKDPNDRPQTAADIAHSLDAVTGGGIAAMPPVLMHGAAAFRRALLVYATAAVVVAIVAKAATIVIGLPDWVFPGALIVMALGLPVILFTGYVQLVTRRAITMTPQLTPGGRPQAHGTMATLALKASPHVSWPRATRGGIVALSAFAALIVAFMVMRALGIGPAASLLSSGRLKQRDPIIVADFNVSHADTSVGSVVAEAVRTGLGESSSITVTSAATVAAALQRMQRPVNSRLDERLARELAAREGLKAIVTGDVTGLGNGFVVAVRLVSVDSGGVLASYQTTVDGPRQLVAGVDEVARKLRGKIGESLKTVRDNPPLAQVSTASLEALRAYTRGVHANDAERDYTKAIVALRQAVSIDTGFAMAWRKLGVVLANAQARQSSVDSALVKVHQLRGRLTEHEASLAEAYYYTYGPGRDRDRGIGIYQAMLDRGDSALVLNNLALAYLTRPNVARAETLFRASRVKYPDLALGYTNLTSTLALQGRWSEIPPILDTVRARFPTNPAVGIERAELLYHEGRMAEFEQAVDSAARSSASIGGRWALREKGNIALLHGRISDGLLWITRANGADSAAGISPAPLRDSIQFARADAWWRGNGARATSRIDAALAQIPIDRLPEADRPYIDAAKAYALAGRPDRARAIMAQRAVQLRDTSLVRFLRGRASGADAEIALAEHRPRDAVTLFRRADPVPEGRLIAAAAVLNVNLARAFDLADMQDSAIFYFEKYETTPELTRLSDDAYHLAGAYKRLGELYEAKGNGPKAEHYLAKFVELWKSADPELQPQVSDARKRLARLRARSG